LVQTRDNLTELCPDYVGSVGEVQISAA